MPDELLADPLLGLLNGGLNRFLHVFLEFFASHDCESILFRVIRQWLPKNKKSRRCFQCRPLIG